MPYGARGQVAALRQQEQDTMNSGSRYASNARAASKASALYVNDAWDLVDAMREKDFDLSKVERSTLPEPLRELSDEGLAAAITEKSQERAKTQSELQALVDERSRYLAEHQPLAAHGGLGTALVSAIMEKATAKGLTRGGE